MAKTTKAELLELVDRFSPEIRAAFLEAIGGIASSADLGRIVRALKAGDIDAALKAIDLDPSAFRPLDLALARAFEAGGIFGSQSFPTLRDGDGNRLIVRFDARNVHAEQILRTHSAALVSSIADDQRIAIRTALQEGMAAGQNSRDVALDIVGRVDASGARVGGIIGLTAQQEEFARAYRAELLSGSPTVMVKALKRSLRDKRFDRTVTRAISAGLPLDAATVDKLVIRYRSALLKFRGDMIGRSEALTAIHVGQNEAYEQAITKGTVKASAVRKIWRSAHDDRVRHTHAAMDGQKVGIREAFTSPAGAKIRFPGDPNAPPSEIVNCRCVTEMKVDFLAGLR